MIDRMGKILLGIWAVIGIAGIAAGLGVYPERSLLLAITIAGVPTVGWATVWLVTEGRAYAG